MANIKVRVEHLSLIVLVAAQLWGSFAPLVDALSQFSWINVQMPSSSSRQNSARRKISCPRSSLLLSSYNQEAQGGSIEEHEYYSSPSFKPHPLQTPHSGRHFLPSHPAYRRQRWGLVNWRHLLWILRRRKRFMEGWYYRLTLTNATSVTMTENGAASTTDGVQTSFAFIISIEDPGLYPKSSDLRLSCIQVVGPDDGYLVQADQDETKFWAWKKQQALGCTFEYNKEALNDDFDMTSTTAMTKQTWRQRVKSGFQIMLPDHLLGRVHGHDGTMGGVLNDQGIPGYCEFDINIDDVLCGWGGGGSGDVDADGDKGKSQQSDGIIAVNSKSKARQKSTAGWLSKFDIFEPHWQVTQADARASGTVVWNNTTYEFQNEPFYAEKNWGAALPSKWYWTQCNAFDGYEQLSVTAGGGIRKVPFGQKESLGMVSVHYNNTFYEAVPWTGSMSWNVSTWGYWQLKGTCTTGTSNPFEVEVTYQCDPKTLPGLVFRAPTPDEGMVYFCRDTFDATTSLTLWELEYNSQTGSFERKGGPPLINNATSTQGGAEIGGGPWWDSWIATSKLKKTISTLLTVPYQIRNVKDKIRCRK